jgi:hypothetical protein
MPGSDALVGLRHIPVEFFEAASLLVSQSDEVSTVDHETHSTDLSFDPRRPRRDGDRRY